MNATSSVRSLLIVSCLAGWLALLASSSLGAENTPREPNAVPAAKDGIHVNFGVIDAQTGKPLAAFNVTEGRNLFGETIQWSATNRAAMTNGRIDLTLARERNPPAILVEADGYLPQSSGAIGETGTNITFALKKGAGPAGVLLKPDGKPAPGVEVFLTDMLDMVLVEDSSLKVIERSRARVRHTQTDEQGRFSFKPRVDDFALFVFAADGFAYVKADQLAAAREIKLDRWAKVRGRLRIGGRAGTNETVRLGLAYFPYSFYPRAYAPVSVSLETKTDANGEFTFERVPPMGVQISYAPRVVDGQGSQNTQSQSTGMVLSAGEVKDVVLGGRGRPVTGRLAVTGYDGKINWRADIYSLEAVVAPTEDMAALSKLNQEMVPKLRSFESEAEKQRLTAEFTQAREKIEARLHAFYGTDEGRAWYFANKRYAMRFADDGSFLIEDVPPGKYRLHVDVRDAAEGLARLSASSVATFDREFDVPGAAGERSDEPLDLGTMERPARTILGAGKTAPDFEVKTVDDKTIHLSDCAGKYVLLDFWAVWCGPCVAETPHLKDTYAAFKDDPRFRMISLSLDGSIKAPEEYARKNDLAWTMGFLGDWSKADLPAKYGVYGIPAIFLIGPDGKIVAKGLRGDNIKAAVAKSLGK